MDAGGCVFGLSRTTADIIFQLQPPFWFFAPNVLYKSDRYILILDESSVASSSTQNFIVWTFSITACRMSVFSFFFFFFFFLFFPFLGAIPCYLVPVVDTGPCQARPPPAHQNEAEQARRACEAYLSKLRSSLIVPTLTNRHERCCSRLYLYWRSF